MVASDSTQPKSRRSGSRSRANRDPELARLLGTGITYAAAGELLGMSETTITRRMADVGFRSRVEREQREYVDRVTAGIVRGAHVAVATLTGVCEDESLPATVRVRAAGSLLSALPASVRQGPGWLQRCGPGEQPRSPVEDLSAEEVDAELRKLQAEVNRLIGPAPLDGDADAGPPRPLGPGHRAPDGRWVSTGRQWTP